MQSQSEWTYPAVEPNVVAEGTELVGTPAKRRVWWQFVVFLVVGVVIGAVVMLPGKKTVEDARDEAETRLVVAQAEVRSLTKDLDKAEAAEAAAETRARSAEGRADAANAAADRCADIGPAADGLVQVAVDLVTISTEQIPSGLSVYGMIDWMNGQSARIEALSAAEARAAFDRAMAACPATAAF